MEDLYQHPYIIDRHTQLVSRINPNKRIVCLHCPYPYNPEFEQLVDKLYDSYDSILVIMSELHHSTVDFMMRYDRTRISYFICGTIHFELKNSTVHTYMDWFATTLHFYKVSNRNVLGNLSPYTKKSFYFDALLGRKKDHRDLVWKYIQLYLGNKGISTYVDDRYLAIDKNDSQKWIWENNGLTFNEVPKFSVEWVEYFGHPVRLSHIVPIKVYQQTAYSLVAETNFQNHFVFFTEKIVKPILGRRLFIIIGNRYSLRTLKDLGFKTFDSIIDESYDDIEATNQRFSAALDQLKWLCEQDQETILAKCREITEHNFNHMWSTDWYQLFLDKYKNYFL
jgi:hypothetical protein